MTNSVLTPNQVNQEIKNVINGILNKMVEMLETHNILNVTIFSEKDKINNHLNNVPFWTYKYYDDTIHVFTKRLFKNNDTWYIEQWDEWNENVVEEIIPLLDNDVIYNNNKYVYTLYTTIYNYVYNTDYNDKF